MALSTRDQILALRRELGILRKVHDELVAEHVGKCEHVAADVEPWSWEHDNGYGQQHMIAGLRCRLCGSVCRHGYWSNR